MKKERRLTATDLEKECKTFVFHVGVLYFFVRSKQAQCAILTGRQLIILVKSKTSEVTVSDTLVTSSFHYILLLHCVDAL